ncbi:glycoside hydrolase [Microthyrium microscopicum]|uniref:Mannosyl-oligosaccharide glucosidase n=1 Tax=Microthyrium microscopicum TaxID=703497 RepID=A0A6A6UNG4_9PEZI|nr:glycoside hydrolase [Microthyrium microscopicum]
MAALLRFLVLVSTVITFATCVDLEDYERATNQSLFWGAYRPNLYFGIRPRTPDGLQMGLLWSKVEDYESVQHNFRYTCEQHAGMAGYGWDRYDPRTGGIQTIHDAGNEIDITTSFVKDTSDGENGGTWAVRIKGTPRPGAPEDLKSTVVFSIASPSTSGLGGLEVDGDPKLLQDTKGLEGDVVIKGEDPTLGQYKITVTEGKGKRPMHTHPSAEEKPLDRTFVATSTFGAEQLWQTRPILFSQLKLAIDPQIERWGNDNLPPPFQFFTLNNKPGVGNQQFVQKVFEGAFEFDVVFSSAESSKALTVEELTTDINTVVKSFDKKFEQLFQPQAPFKGDKYLEMSKALFSNLLGGIGYFHGDWVSDRSYAPEYEEENEGFWDETADARSRVVPKREEPVELFTSIPSRPFFPRGFLWDEGFHLMPVLDWDVDLALNIVQSWFKLIDEDGWIAREQILGEEARSKVPQEFQVQYPHYANPPTLFLILTTYIDKLALSDVNKDKTSLLLNKESAQKYLSELYPLLKRHYEWFRRTQQGEIETYDREAFSSKEGYRWRGRTPTHCLPSGLDDYPRAQPPHPGELHVDAMSWIGLMAQSLRKIATFIGEKDDAKKIGKQEEAIIKNLDELHWDERAGVYCDATIDQYEEDVHVCHKGYISLFPFMVGLMKPEDPKIAKLLAVISDPNELWSDYGIRSLSKSDEHYGSAENYWRSPIWINMNYLILQRLLEVAQTKGPNQARAKEVYISLRKNLVSTVSKAWDSTGFAWEQYNPETGEGQRTQHFTGWTSLTVKMMAMPDLSNDGPKDEL